MSDHKMHWRGLPMDGLADAAKATADHTRSAIDDAVAFVNASNTRIASMESAESVSSRSSFA